MNQNQKLNMKITKHVYKFYRNTYSFSDDDHAVYLPIFGNFINTPNCFMIEKFKYVKKIDNSTIPINAIPSFNITSIKTIFINKSVLLTLKDFLKKNYSPYINISTYPYNLTWKSAAVTHSDKSKLYLYDKLHLPPEDMHNEFIEFLEKFISLETLSHSVFKDFYEYQDV